VADDDEPEIYPLDVTKLTRGDVIEQVECERIAGVAASHARYRLHLEGLRDWIMKESEARGCPLSVATHGNGLRINTDVEASTYHARLCKQGERQIYRNLHRLTTTVRREVLPQREQEAHDRRCALLAQKVFRLRGKGAIGTETVKQIEG